MRRWLIVLLLVQTLLGSVPGWALPAAAAGDEVPAAPDHVLLHVNEVAHHHHPDGSIGLDDAQASCLHLLTDHGMASLPAAEPAGLLSGPRGDRRPTAAPAGRAGPWPDRILRPPRG